MSHPGKVELFVPGRLCLFGEHSDWAGGYRRMDSALNEGHCLIVGTDQGIYASAKAHKDKFSITSTLPDGQTVGPHEMEMDVEALQMAAKLGGFYSYCAGVASHMQTHFKVGGLEIHSSKMDLPIRKGLSSSAAICVLVARAFNQVYHLGLSLRDEMEVAYQGEILTPSRCGRMDQACAFGKIPVFLVCDGDNVEVETLRPAADFYLLIVDLHRGKDTKRILADLNSCFPEGRGKIGADVRYALGPVNKEVLFRAHHALEAGDAEELGHLMSEAQRLFDEFVAPACPEELSAPKLHQVLRYPKIQKLIWGGKGVGSQGDGCCQFLCRGPEEQEEVCRRLKALDVECFPLHFGPHGNGE